MNIAFPAFLLIVLLMPGIIYRRSRAASDAFSERRPLIDEIGLSLIVALAMQILWYFLCWVLSDLTRVSVDLQSTIVLLTGRSTGADNLFPEAIAAVTEHPFAVSSYFFTLYCFAQLAGVASRYLDYPLRKLRGGLRQRFNNLKFLPTSFIPSEGRTNRSAFHLSSSIDPRDDYGDEAGMRRFGQWMRACELSEEVADSLGNHVLLVVVAAIVELGGSPVLYKGFLDKAFFAPDGDLERISLSNTMRRAVSVDETDTPSPSPATELEDRSRPKYYTVAGDTFILRMAEVKTVNFLYYAIMPGHAQDHAAVEAANAR